MKIALLPGDGIGPEILREAVRILDALRGEGMKIETEEAPVGGAAYDVAGDPLPQATLALARGADAVLFGAVGGPRYDTLPRDKRPEQAILGLRRECDFFANLRPATVFPELADASTLKPEVVSGLDIMIVRELTGDIYFGQPRGITGERGSRVGINTMHYTEAQIRRILHVGFRTARQRLPQPRRGIVRRQLADTAGQRLSTDQQSAYNGKNSYQVPHDEFLPMVGRQGWARKPRKHSLSPAPRTSLVPTAG